MARRHTRAAIAALAAALVVAAQLLRFGAALALSVELAVPRAESWLTRLGPEPVREEIAIAVGGRRLDADLYWPSRPRSAILLVHGLSRAGRRQPELVRLARLLARQHELVLVPAFEGLAAFRLSGREVEEVRSALRYLTRLSDSVSVAGFSFGGYADLRNVVAYATTGAYSFDGRHYQGRQEEYNRWKLLALLAGFVNGRRDRGLLAMIAAAKLADPAAPTARLERQLGDEGRRVMALALNRREAAVGGLLAGLPRRAGDAVDRLSPLRVVSRLPGRLLIGHGVDDDSIPFTESLRLADAAGGRAQVAVLQTFNHIGPDAVWRSLRLRAVDGWNLFRLADALLPH